MDLFIIDAAGPFFKKYKNPVINWSKIPYEHFEQKLNRFQDVLLDFEKYIKRISKEGYNAISLDDLCHLVSFDFYPKEIIHKINNHRKYFHKFFLIAKKYNLKVFLTSDIMFYNKYIHNKVKKNDNKIILLLKNALTDIFSTYKEIDGIIFRIGESDGIDVRSFFRSKIIIKNPGQANNYIKRLLPVFDSFGKTMIFRTWTLGIYKIGDLIWNPKTFLKVFKNINNPNFIISLKYGKADFFRYLELNDLFNKTNHKKIIELQTRREYEGFGEYPSFVGFDYETYYNQLKGNNNVVGIHVWCQTGGWSVNKNLTFLKKSSFWNELNTKVTINIFKKGNSCEKALKEILNYRFNKEKNILFIDFLKKSDFVIKNLLYDPFFYKKELYFNRIKIPTNPHVYWENVIVNKFTFELYNCSVGEKEKSIELGFYALKMIKEMREISKKIGLCYDFRFHYKTFKIFFHLRKLIYTYGTNETEVRLLISNYKIEFPSGYKFHVTNQITKNSYIRFFIKVFFRKGQKYRLFDKLFFNIFTKKIFFLILKIFKNKLPSFINKQGMKIENFF
jgi:hypothetical protein